MTQQLEWRVHTSELFDEILTNSKTTIIFEQPLRIIRELLSKVALRAIELNDPQLHQLMVRLTLYSMADPNSPDYNPDMVDIILKEEVHKLATSKEEN